MTSRQRLRELFERYVEELELHGVVRAPESLCHDEPELLQPLKELVEAHASIASDLRGSSLFDSGQTIADNTTVVSAESSSDDQTTVFTPGELVAGRYRIVRFIARGGMGELFEAIDLDLEERVALKTIRQDLVGQPQTLDRFKREILLARKISHPNVCRLLEFGSHVIPRHDEEPERRVYFLTMELLSGETLSQRVRRQGPLSEDEALPIIQQLSGALAAAHEIGIVHRDFKSANVILEATPGGGERAVVTDFGLARLFRSGSEGGGVTVTGQIVGTPAYMAPEQLLGAEVGPPADIYALGVTCFEMLTGDLPFSGASTVAMAMERLRGDTPSPRRKRPSLDARWDAVVVRCLEREPSRRFASANDIAATLVGDLAETRHAERRHLSRLLMSALAALLLVVAASGLYLGYRGRDRSAKSHPADHRPGLAVVGFKNLGSPEQEWLSTALAEMLRTELAASEQLRIVPGESISRMKIEQKLTDSDSLAESTLDRIRSLASADLVVLGSYLTLGTQSGMEIRLDTKVQSAVDGNIVVSFAERRSQDELFDLVSDVGARLRRELGVESPSADVGEQVSSTRMATPEIARLYSEGVARLRRFDAKGAIQLLQQAAEAQPEHPLIHLALADAWTRLGFDTRAREEATIAVDRSRDLPRALRLEVAGRSYSLAGNWDKAIETYSSLFTFFPDDIERGLELAETQVSAGRSERALATIEQLRKLPKPSGSDPRIDLVQADAAQALTDYQSQLKAAGAAATRAQAQGAILLYAQARARQCDAQVHLGSFAKAQTNCDEARTLFTAAGDGNGVATTENILGVASAMQGDMAHARQAFERALAEFHKIGDRQGIFKQLNNVANAMQAEGDFTGAERTMKEALEIAQEIGDLRGVGIAKNNIGAAQWQRGELAQATVTYGEALEIFTTIGAQSHQAYAFFNLGEVLHARGELSAARRNYEEALGLFREMDGAETDVADALVGLGRVLAEEGLDSAARERFLEAKAIYARTDNPEGLDNVEKELQEEAAASS